MFEITTEEGSARVGRLKTRHGCVETPFFMPVVTKSGVRCIGFDDYHPLGADGKQCLSIEVDAIISNSLLLYLSPGLESIERFNGIHGVLDFDKVIFTDSGGFQSFEQSSFRIQKDKKGIFFKASHTGSRIFLSPQLSMHI